MSAVFYAAGPDIEQGRLPQVRTIDVAPTIAGLLGLKLAPLVNGSVIPLRVPRKVSGES